MTRITLDVDVEEIPAVIDGLTRSAANYRRASEAASRDIATRRRAKEDVRTQAVQVADLLAHAAILDDWADVLDAIAKNPRNVVPTGAGPSVLLGDVDLAAADPTGPDDPEAQTLPIDDLFRDDDDLDADPLDESALDLSPEAAESLHALQAHPDAVVR